MVERELGSGLGTEAYVKLSREFSELGPVIETIKTYRAVGAEIADLDAMIADAGDRRRDAQDGGGRKAGAGSAARDARTARFASR